MDKAATRPHSSTQRLVDRFIDVTSWPTSQKTALVMLIAIPFQTVAWALVALHAEALSDIFHVADLRTNTAEPAGSTSSTSRDCWWPWPASSCPGRSRTRPP